MPPQRRSPELTPHFSLVIPCHNEEESLEDLIQKCQSLTQGGLSEVILVENGSTDNSWELMSDLVRGNEYLRVERVQENRGYGFGIISGLRTARGRVVGWTHADLQTDPRDALSGFALFTRFGDEIFVKGQRRGRPITDSAFTVGMSLFETVTLRSRFWDINAQPTIFSKRFFQTWRNPPLDFSLDLYAYYQARKARLRVFRFPVEFRQRQFGQSHWNVNWKQKRKFVLRTMDYSRNLRRSIRK